MELEEKKELEGEYVKAIDDLKEQHQKATKEKDEEIDDLKKRLQATMMEKTRRGCLSIGSRMGRKV